MSWYLWAAFVVGGTGGGGEAGGPFVFQPPPVVTVWRLFFSVLKISIMEKHIVLDAKLMEKLQNKHLIVDAFEA